jgi:hypothetical protein
VRSFIGAQLERVREAGYEVEICLVDTGATADATLERCLESKWYDCVMIGAGLRDAAHLLLFERLLNMVHSKATGAALCFNTRPGDTLEAVGRWIPHRAEARGCRGKLPVPSEASFEAECR